MKAYLVASSFPLHWHFHVTLITSSCCCLFLLNTHTSSLSYRKDAKKVSKLEAQIPYHEGRGNLEEVTKIKEQVEAIWEKAREEAHM